MNHTKAGAQEGPARASFRQKVEYLESLLGRPGPAEEWYPTTIKDLSSWEDPNRGFTKWVSFSVATLNGPNGDLRRRYDTAVSRLAATKEGKKRRGREVTHAMALAEVSALAVQNAQLVEQIIQLSGELTRRNQYVSLLEQREQELIDKLNKLLPMDKRLVSKAAR